MRADGSGVRNVTQSAGLYESHPAWMPDGRLSYSWHGETGPIHVWALDLASGVVEPLPTDAQPVFAFSWSPRS